MDSVSQRRRPLVWPALLPFCLLSGLPADANPTGGNVTQGSATFSSSGSTFNINQTSANAFINWQSFNVGLGETVNFNQPTAQSVTFNLINQGNASQILGDINAPGYVVLENASGFYIGGQAAITAHGLVLTTAVTPSLNLSSGGPWSFDAPPPTAQIANYGKINITGGGTAYLIAADIVNNGTITAPNGQIGLYDGETVLVSTTPNGQGLNAAVTLPQGSVDNEGQLTANGGSVVAQAAFVNQNGIIQANSAQNVNGTIELLGSSSVTLGANSSISAAGDSTASSPSAGGSVQIQAGSSFSDAVGSTINVSGATQGGNAGQVSISAPQMTALNSIINGQATAGYLNGTLSIDTADITLNSDGSPAANGGLALDIAALSSGLSQVNLQASDDITLNPNTQWTLAVNGGIPSSVLLQAGNTIDIGSGSKIEADGGNITLKAPTVDQAGTLQADSVGSVNGVIEIDACLDLILEDTSQILANGDPGDTSASPGGFVVLNAANGYSDAAGSTISVSGNTAGGQGGIAEIFDPGAGSTPIQTVVSGAFAYLVNPYDLTLSDNSSGTSLDGKNNLDANFNLNDLAAYSQIDLQSLHNIELSADWTLSTSSLPAILSLTAGNDITVDDGFNIFAAQDWSLNLTAGTAYSGTTAPASGSDGIYLDGSAYIESLNGNINLWAANEVQVGWMGTASAPGTANAGTGSITTGGGGNINVTTSYGDVNTGSGTGGFTYLNTAPYYKISAGSGLGGISTADGGNVSIAAGVTPGANGNVISYTPNSSDSSIGNDPGTGTFGTQPGNLTITASGSVYGHYVLANGVGTITAENGNVGTDSSGNQFALSLIDGTWYVNAPNGNIYLTEVRNPTGDYNDAKPTLGKSGTAWVNLFTYGADDAVDLTAGDGVYLTDSLLPRVTTTSDPGEADISVIYPSILDITAGAGGVTLEGDVTLFPSVDQNLKIITTDGGSLVSTLQSGTYAYLLMSDSSYTKWVNEINGIPTDQSFGLLDFGDVFPTEFQPAIIDISGNIGGGTIGTPNEFTSMGLDIYTTKETDITVGGNIINSSFSGQNLSANDVTSINVAGLIYNSSAYSIVNGVTIPAVPANDLPPGLVASWDDIFALAVNPSELSTSYLESLLSKNNPPLSPSTILVDILESASMFSAQQNGNGQLSGINPGFTYNPTTGQLVFGGQMSAALEQELESGTFTVLHLVNGEPAINPATGQIWTDTINWAPGSAITTLYTDSQGAPSPNSPTIGYQIGGPGQFDVTAGSISLGDTYGIISCGAGNPAGTDPYEALAPLTSAGAGASINVTVTGADGTDPVTGNPLPSLSMLTSAIAAVGGGSVTVTSEHGSMDLGVPELSTSASPTGTGIYTTGGGAVTVIAQGDVNIDGSRIASYNGGKITVESMAGNVNVGSGGSSVNNVYVSYVNPLTGLAASYVEYPFGSGIIANTLVPPFPGTFWPPNPATAPGDITVTTPEGSINSTAAGIIQEALDGSIAPGPTVTLYAGTPNPANDWTSKAPPLYVGNIDLGDSGVIGGNVIIGATGNIIGQIISRQNSTVNAGQNFSGTLLSGGSADVTGNGTVSGTIVGVGGADVQGGIGVTASVLGQNVSVNGTASDTLGSTATATASTQSAAQQANSQSQQQVASDQTQGNDDDKKKKKNSAIHVSRVTVLLSSAVAK